MIFCSMWILYLTMLCCLYDSLDGEGGGGGGGWSGIHY